MPDERMTMIGELNVWHADLRGYAGLQLRKDDPGAQLLASIIVDMDRLRRQNRPWFIEGRNQLVFGTFFAQSSAAKGNG